MHFTPQPIQPMPVVATRHDLINGASDVFFVIIGEMILAAPWWLLVFFGLLAGMCARQLLAWAVRRFGFRILTDGF